MNNIYLLDEVIDNLEKECYQLNQQVQEIYSNVPIDENDKDMFNPYPTPIEKPLTIDENMLNDLSAFNETLSENNQFLAMVPNSKTFDPIMVSNGESKTITVNSEMMDNEKELAMIMAIQEMNTNCINNDLFDESCNGIEIDLLQNLVSMQNNPINDSIPLDISVDSILAEIQNNHVSLLGGSTISPNKFPN